MSVSLIDRGVGEHLEAGFFGGPDAFDRFLEHALAFDGEVVILFHAIQVDVEDQARMRLEILQPLAR